MGKFAERSKIKEIRKNHDKIAFCTGCYDILHSGHAVFFSQCRQFAGALVVGIGTDNVVRKLKGPGRPINPEKNRAFLVAAMKDVDYAMLNDEKMKDGKIDFFELISELKPDVFVLNDDDSAIDEKKKLCASLGIMTEIVPRTVPDFLKPTSSTEINEKRAAKQFFAPLRIDFAGGWSDISRIMNRNVGYVSNAAINPLIKMQNGDIDAGSYPKAMGLSTSTSIKALEMIQFNGGEQYLGMMELKNIAEELYNLENKNLSWLIGRQDAYAIIHGGFNCFRFAGDDTGQVKLNITEERLRELQKGLLLFYTGTSREAQSVVNEVYRNFNADKEKFGRVMSKISRLGLQFAKCLEEGKLEKCASIMSENWEAQKELASASTTPEIDEIYDFAMNNGASGGKLCGAGNGGCFVFYSGKKEELKEKLEKRFSKGFAIDFEFEMNDIKKLNMDD